VSYPSYPTIAAAPLDSALLTSLATSYVGGVTTPVSAEFSFVYLPTWAFNQLNDLESSSANTTQIMGILYYAGYFGGQWLRIRLNTRPANVPSAALTGGVNTNINTGLAAAAGVDPLDYTIAQQNSTVDSFGYNSGYFRTILDHPPSGITADNPTWDFQYDSTSALSATFNTEQLSNALFDYKQWFHHLNQQKFYEDQRNSYISIQAVAYARGVTTWTGALNVIGFSSGDYLLLLEASSMFLEIAKLNSGAVSQSVGFANQNLASSAAIMNAGYLGFNGAYLVGLLNGANDNTSPFPYPTLSVTF